MQLSNVDAVQNILASRLQQENRTRDQAELRRAASRSLH
jgi:hypothetical protein